MRSDSSTAAFSETTTGHSPLRVRLLIGVLFFVLQIMFEVTFLSLTFGLPDRSIQLVPSSLELYTLHLENIYSWFDTEKVARNKNLTSDTFTSGAIFSLSQKTLVSQDLE